MDIEIHNSEAVTSVFGYWPNFHDAEVVELSLMRAGESSAFPSARVKIHAFRVTSEIDDRGRYVTTDHSLVTMLFERVEALELDGFNHQNAINRLRIEAIDGDRLAVNFEAAYGLDCAFQCRSASVLSVEPGIPRYSICST
nr:Imm50 family immunity protein [Pseudoxanthomonas sp.]